MTKTQEGLWGEEIWSQRHTQIPNALLKVNLHLPKEERLDPVEFFILVKLISHIFEPKRTTVAFPTMQQIADESGAGIGAIRRGVAKLKDKGWLKPYKPKGLNWYNYDIKTIQEKLEPIAKAHPLKKKGADSSHVEEEDDDEEDEIPF